MSEWIAPEATRYPERADPGFGWLQRLERRLWKWPARCRQFWVRRDLAGLKSNAGAITFSIESLRNTIRRDGLTRKSLVLWYGWAAERGADEEVISGALALIRGMAVQCTASSSQAGMAAFASAAIALSGRSVHVLVRDDAGANQLEPVLRKHLQGLGLRVAVIESGSPVMQRRPAYHAPVTIISGREALRDYLEDRLLLRPQPGEIRRKLGRLVGLDPLQNARMRGLPFGIVVDANQTLIDQACEPLIIAGRTDPASEKAWAETVLALARDLEEGVHYTVGLDQNIQLTEAGHLQLEGRAGDLSGVWHNTYRRNSDISLALRVLRLEPGRHYRVVDQRVELPTGIPAPEGLIQLLEAREGVLVTGRPVARGKLTFQRFFRRYERLAALCSDISYIQNELWNIYGLPGFIITPPPAGPMPDMNLLSEADMRMVNAISGFSESLGKKCVNMLFARRLRKRRKTAEHLRRSMLLLDYQIGNITAFSGRAE